MKLILTTIIALFAIIINSPFSIAADFDLGNFSHQKITDKFSQEINLKVGATNIVLPSSSIKSWLKEQGNLSYNPDYNSEIESGDICTYKKSIDCNLTYSIALEPHIQRMSSISIDEDAIIKYIDDLARKVNKDPQNAKLKFENGKISAFALNENGLEIDKDKSLEAIVSALAAETVPQQIELPYKETVPEISINSIDNMGITSLIGEGRSNFKGSPKNRIFNIKVATKRFDGILIKPGEEFSFVKILGEVDGEHGYLPELVIKKDKTEPEFGGGICQVSTTAFRAAIYSGLKITARRNHAYPVSYYSPHGMDSTVYVPRPDLQFINNTPGYVLIQTEIIGTELIFKFYGTNDGRTISVDGPKILEKNPDGSMKTTFTQKVTDKDGVILLEDIFNSNYESPSKFPHVTLDLSKKPKDWSTKQWEQYKKDNKI